MRKIPISAIIIFVLVIFCSLNAKAATPSDYLILQSIGEYHNSGKGKCGNGAGFLEAADHFSVDHNDTTCRTGYYNLTQDLAISIQVTKHAGAGSDHWLLHEVEDGYRDGDDSDNQLGMLSGQGVKVRSINANPVIYWGLGGGHYTSISTNNVVIEVNYTDLQRTKPEPLEVIQAYLQKFPSTIPATLVLDKTHDEKWIKDEMERRLWLGDKWFAWQAGGNTTIPDTLQKVSDNITIFLDYRQKYFGINGDSDKENLYQLVSTQNLQGVKDKLSEYKTWWSNNKTDSINLP